MQSIRKRTTQLDSGSDVLSLAADSDVLSLASDSDVPSLASETSLVAEDQSEERRSPKM